LRDNTDLAFALPVAGLHLDLCRGPGQANTVANDAERILEDALARAGEKHLSLGVVDGRNVWKCDLSKTLRLLEKAVARLGVDRVLVAPSCSLLHTPMELAAETHLDPTLRNWLAFATDKLLEVKTLARGAGTGRAAIQGEIETSDAVRRERTDSALIHDAQVQARLASITPQMQRRRATFAERSKLQRELFQLPPLPTTTIGSFPQTGEIRQARAAFRRGELAAEQYRAAMQAEIRTVIDYQERIGLDVLVHGEAERNDMVEYFGEQLNGFAFTRYGWVPTSSPSRQRVHRWDC
jgi:5-methyltetrahydropteroyltriglutamate--homocysteine methyltransferase